MLANDRKPIASSPHVTGAAESYSHAFPRGTPILQHRTLARLAGCLACLTVVTASLDALITRIRIDQASTRVAQLRHRRDDLTRISRLEAQRADVQHHNAALSRAVRNAFSDQPRLALAGTADFSVEVDDAPPSPLPGAVSRVLAVMPRESSGTQPPSLDRFAAQGPLQHVMATFTAAAGEAQRMQAAGIQEAGRAQPSPPERAASLLPTTPAPEGAR